MSKQYQIIQERYADEGDSEPTLDYYPVLFASIEEARERANKYGLDRLFEHRANSYWIAELEPAHDSLAYTGRQFRL